MRSWVVAPFLLLATAPAGATVMPGDTAPGFTLQDVSAVSYSLAGFAGKVVLLAFVGYG